MDVSALSVALLIGAIIFVMLGKVFSRKDDGHADSGTKTSEDSPDKTPAQGKYSLEVSDDDLDGAETGGQAVAVKNKVPPLYRPPKWPQKIIGRKADLEEIFKNSDQTGVILAGQNDVEGIGKTALALKVAEKMAVQFPGGQIFLHLKGDMPTPMPLIEIMSCVIWAFYPKMKLSHSKEIQKIYQSLLEEKKVLLILDNAKGAEQVKPLAPSSGNSFLLVTARETFSLPGFYTKIVLPLERKASQRLLESLVPNTGVMVDEISKVCDYLPLSIQIAGGVLSYTKSFTPLQVSGKIQSKRKMLEQMSFDKSNKCVEAIFKVSYGNLKSSITKVLCRLSIFPGAFDAKAEEHICNDFNHGDLKKLAGLGLVVYDEQNERYWLSSQIRRFASGYLNKGDMIDAQKRNAKYYLKVLENAYKLFNRADKPKAQMGLNLFDLEWKNIQAAQAWTAENMGSSKDTADMCCAFAKWGSIFLSLRLPDKERVQWRDIALSAAREMKDDKEEMEQLMELGNIFLETGDSRQAMKYFKPARELARDLGRLQEEINLLMAQGQCYLAQENPVKAVAFFEQVLDNKPSDRFVERSALTHLGAAFSSLGNSKKARNFHGKAYTVAHQIGDRLGEGNSLWFISLTSDGMGDREQAVVQAEAALKVFQNLKHANAKKVRAKLKKWKEAVEENGKISVVEEEKEMDS